MPTDRKIRAVKSLVDSSADVLRRKIQSGELGVDGRIPSLRRLADILKVSHDTIWRAMRELETERMVIATATGRFRVHPRFKLLSASQRLLKVAFVAQGEASFEHRFIERVFLHLNQNCDAFLIELKLILHGPHYVFDAAELEDVDAAILSPGWAFPHFEALRAAGKMTVGLNAPFHYRIPCGVHIDDFHGGELAGRALSARAPRRVVVTGESQLYPGRWHEPFELRAIGFRRAWLESGRASADIVERPLPVDTVPALKDIQKLVSEQREPTSYFCLSDRMGLLLLGAIKDAGRRVPEDALVIGFDGSQEAAAAGLSSLCPAPERIAEALMKQLRVVEHEGATYNEIVFIKPRLIERSSLGADGETLN